MSDADLLATLRTLASGSDRLVDTVTLPARVAVTRQWPDWLPPEIRMMLTAHGLGTPWSHQVQAAQALHENQHVILTTGTGSGKSIAVWAPFLAAVYEHEQHRGARGHGGRLSAFRRRPTAIYLAPTKALAADQMLSLQRLTNPVSISPEGVRDAPVDVGAATATVATGSERGFLRVGTADGDTTREAKRWAAENADVIATNPDFLHHVLLARPQFWERVLRGLNLIVFDEVHFYRGIAAANIALVLRRLLRLAALHGAQPRVAFLSATTNDPVAVVQRFLGCHADQVTAVTVDGSAAAERTVVLWQPGLIPGADTGPDVADLGELKGADTVAALLPDGALADGACDPLLDALLADDPPPAQPATTPKDDVARFSATTEAAQLTAAFAQTDARFLTFSRSRPGTEAIAEMARAQLRQIDPARANRIRAYRGGYLPHERRELERQLRTGAVSALVTTSALEVGIDISGLDATITTGWPGTRASFWQQAGRAGRRGRPATNVFVAGDNPLDTYFLNHPQALFDAVETTVFSVDNPYVLGPHLCSAAAEAPLTPADLPRFGDGAARLVSELVAAGLLRERPNGWYWNVALEQNPHDLVDLRGSGTEVQVVNSSDGAVVGSVPLGRANATVHPGARYVHQGQLFVVEDLHWDDRVAFVRPSIEQLRTRANIDAEVQILECEQQRRCGEFTLACGSVRVTQSPRSYDLLRLPGLQFVGEEPLALPSHSFETRAVWWTVSERWLSDQLFTMELLPGALHGAEHASIGILPLLATCDRWDLGGLSTALHSQTELPTIFVHDAISGGSGIADYGYEAVHEWVCRTYETIRACHCRAGCPRCIVSPKCGNNNRPLSKSGALSLLAGLLSAFAQ